MEFSTDLNYTILSNSINPSLLNKVSEYNVLSDDLSYEQVKEKLENYLSKIIVFNDCLRIFSKEQKKKLLELMYIRKIKFINITSNIEESLFGDYIFVFDHETLAIEGKTEDVLKEEKILKRIGFGLPFVVDLSMQLNYYNVLDKVYYDMESLVDAIWN